MDTITGLVIFAMSLVILAILISIIKDPLSNIRF